MIYFLFICRRIAYQESTQSFAVISRRTELQDSATGKSFPTHLSASLTASNITYCSAQGPDAVMATSSKINDGIPLEEVELFSVLIVDQHTFEGRPLSRLNDDAIKA